MSTPNHVCELCGRAYYRKKQARFVSRFCSKTCMYDSHTGSGNPNYRGGHNRKAARDAALKYRDHRCAICQWDMHVDAHHIIPRARGGNGDYDNIVLLCPNHHWMADNGHYTVEQLRSLVYHFCLNPISPSVGDEHPSSPLPTRP